MVSIRRLAAWVSFAGLVASSAGAAVVVTTMPGGMVQVPGQATATDRFAVTNTGAATVSVTVTARGSFFSVSPASFALRANDTQVVQLRAETSVAGTYVNSASIVFSSQPAVDVPVKLLVTNPPPERVAIAAVDLLVLSNPPPQIVSPPPPPPPERVRFSNPGPVAVNALVVTDAAWLEPIQNFVTIPAGGTATVDVQVQPSKRPDAPEVIGSATGKVSVVFLSAPATTSTTAPVTTVSTVVVHVNKASVNPGAAPPLHPSETAFFIPGYGAIDLSLFARGNQPSISNLQLYHERSGFSAFPQLPAYTGISFANLAATAGAVQIRTPDFASLSLAAMKTSVAAGRAYFSVLPILVSQQGAMPGGKMYLTGVAKDAMTTTDLHLQEVSGNAATVRVEFLDRNGSVVLSGGYLLARFASLRLSDGVPPGAVTVVVANDTSSSGRVAAIAVVTDRLTGDMWPIRDGGIAAAGTGEALLVPIVDNQEGARTEVHVVNRGSDVALARLEVTPSLRERRRAAARSRADATGTIVPLAPNAATTFLVERRTQGALARISTTGGALAASSRTLTTEQGIGTWGSAVPVVAVSSALGAGESRLFAGIEDAAATTVAAQTPLTYRSELTLVETRNESAVVRLTLQYTVSAGLASARAVHMRDVTVPPGAFVFLGPLAQAIVGEPRKAFGDLRNMLLTVEVLSGAGRVIPVVQTTENHSGDISIRGQ